MIIRNNYTKTNDLIKDKKVNGEHITLTVTHRLDESSELTGWFMSITTHDPVTDETDWGFCSGWCESYLEAKRRLTNNTSYKTYPFFG